MDVYKIVITVIALVVVTLLSVLAEMLGRAQQKRREAKMDHRKPPPDKSNETRQDESIASTVGQTRVDTEQNRECSQPEVRKHRQSNSEQDR